MNFEYKKSGVYIISFFHKAINQLHAHSVRIGAYFLLFIIFATSIIALPMIQSSVASAATEASSKTGINDIDWKIKSYIYYKAVAACIEKSNLSSLGLRGQYIENEDAGNYAWFRKSGLVSTFEKSLARATILGIPASESFTSTSVTVDSYTNNANIGSDHGVVECSSTSFLRDAIDNIWGLDPITVLCNSGFYRDSLESSQSPSDCIAAKGLGGDFKYKSNPKDAANAFRSYIRKTIYGDKEPELNDADAYVFLRESLNNSCLPGISSNPPTDNGGEHYKGVPYVNVADKNNPRIDSSGGYYGNSSNVVIDAGHTVVGGVYSLGGISKCADIVSEISKKEGDTFVYAQAYLKLFEKSNSTEKDKVQQGLQDTPSSTNSCGENVPGVGWIVCPTINALSSMNDGMWKITQNLLKVNPIRQSNEGVYAVWGVIRNIANILFVIAFMIIVFSQVSNIGISNYGIKKMLPRLIVSAILVNLSFLFVQIAVDIANIVGSGLYELINNTAPKVKSDVWGDILGTIIKTAATGIVVGGVSLTAIGIMPALLFLLPALLAGAIGLVAAVVTLMFRQAAIPVLAVLAPIAFVAYLLPNTEGWYKKWQSLFVSMLMLYPLAAVIFAGSQFAAKIIMSQGGWFNSLSGLIIMTLPLFSLPFLASKSSAFANAISGKVKTMFSKPQEGFNKWAGKEAEYAVNKHNTSVMNNPNSLKGKFLRYQARRKAINDNQVSEFERSKTGYIADTVASDSKFRGQMVAGGVAGSADRALAKAESTRAKLLNEENSAAEVLVKNLGPDDIHTLSRGGKVGGLDAGASLALRTAAWKKTVDSGDAAHINELMNSVSNGTLGSDEAVKSLAEVLQASPSRPSYIGMGHIEMMKQSVGGKLFNKDTNEKEPLNGADSLISAAIANNTYSADKLASASKDELEQVLNVAATMDKPAKAKFVSSIETLFTNPSYSGRVSKQIDTLNDLKAAANMTPTEYVEYTKNKPSAP